MPSAKATQTASSASQGGSPSLLLQRKCACGASSNLTGDCDECQSKRLLGKPLQPKLRIGQQNDEYEREADRVADEVMRGPATPAGARSISALTAPLIQRRTAEHGPAGAQSVPAIVHDVLSSPGQPLDTTERAFFEPRFGHDFSRVRVHADARAAKSAQAVNAAAYTVGSHVVLSDASSRSRALLAHELVHVVQQGESPAASVLQRCGEPAVTETSQESSGFLANLVEGAARQAAAALGSIDPQSLTRAIDTALHLPVISSFLLAHPALAAQRQSLHLLLTTPGALDAVWGFIENPQAHQAAIRELLLSRISEAKRHAAERGHEWLVELGVPEEQRERLSHALKSTAAFAQVAFDFVLKEVILDTVLFWELRSEHEIFDTAWCNYEQGSIDALDLIIEHLSIVLNVIGRIEDLMPLLLIAAGTVSGGGIGGTVGSVVPVAGTASGAGAGSGTGATAGVAASEVLGLVAVIGPAALEWNKAVKAALQLSFSDQTEDQRKQDQTQICASIVSLIVMGLLAFVPGLAIRVGRAFGRRLLALLPDISTLLSPLSAMVRADSGSPSRAPAEIPATTVSTPAPESSSEPAQAVDEPSPTSTHTPPRDIEASVALSSLKESKELLPQEKVNEAAWVDVHQHEVVSGDAPHRQADIGAAGRHKIVEDGDGGCSRHSTGGIEVPCPLVFQPAPGEMWTLPSISPPLIDPLPPDVAFPSSMRIGGGTDASAVGQLDPSRRNDIYVMNAGPGSDNVMNVIARSEQAVGVADAHFYSYFVEHGSFQVLVQGQGDGKKVFIRDAGAGTELNESLATAALDDAKARLRWILGLKEDEPIPIAEVSISHVHPDHFSMLEKLIADKQLQIGQIVLNKYQHEDLAGPDWMTVANQAQAAGIPIRLLAPPVNQAAPLERYTDGESTYIDQLYGRSAYSLSPESDNYRPPRRPSDRGDFRGAWADELSTVNLDSTAAVRFVNRVDMRPEDVNRFGPGTHLDQTLSEGAPPLTVSSIGHHFMEGSTPPFTRHLVRKVLEPYYRSMVRYRRARQSGIGPEGRHIVTTSLADQAGTGSQVNLPTTYLHAAAGYEIRPLSTPDAPPLSVVSVGGPEPAAYVSGPQWNGPLPEGRPLDVTYEVLDTLDEAHQGTASGNVHDELATAQAPDAGTSARLLRIVHDAYFWRIITQLPRAQEMMQPMAQVSDQILKLEGLLNSCRSLLVPDPSNPDQVRAAQAWTVRATEVLNEVLPRNPKHNQAGYLRKELKALGRRS